VDLSELTLEKKPHFHKRSENGVSELNRIEAGFAFVKGERAVFISLHQED
jgi:hypothetical protein